MANYMIDADYDITREKNEIIDILDRNETISALPAGLSQRCLKLFNFVVFSMLMPQSHRDKELREDNEFLSFLLIKIKRIVDYTIPTLQIGFYDNEYVLSFNPYFLFQHTILEMVNLIKHELYHMIWQHPLRGPQYLKNFSHEEINIAMDVTVNQYLSNLPEGCVTLDWFRDLFKSNEYNDDDNFSNRNYIISRGSLEDYMEYISKSKAHKEMKSLKKEIKELVKKMMNDNQINKNNNESENGSSTVNIQLSNDSQDNSKDKINKGEGYTLDHKWDKELNEQDSKLAKEVLKSLLNDAKNNMRGTIPSHIMSLINELNVVPELEWQDYLRRYVGSVPVPYKKSIMRNDRRQPNRIELKGRLSDHEVRIVAAVDVSGSVSNELLKDFVSEIFFITKGLKKKTITLIQCDASIQSVDIIKNPDDIKKVKRNGQGGTSFSPVFEYLRDNDMKNDILIYFTDGEGEKELTCKPRHYKTIWVLHKDNLWGDKRQPKLSLDEPYGIIRVFDENKLRAKI